MKSQAINTIKHPSLWEICHKTLRPKGRKGLVRLILIFMSLFTLTTAHAQDAKELYKKGKELYEAKKYNEAFPILKTAADKGNKKAQYRVGRCYAKGKGVKEDKTIAFQWYTKSAKQDYAKAQYALGRCYMKGNGTTADPQKAKTWLSKAIKNPKGGDEILKEVKEKAKEGDDDAKNILKIVGK